MIVLCTIPRRIELDFYFLISISGQRIIVSSKEHFDLQIAVVIPLKTILKEKLTKLSGQHASGAGMLMNNLRLACMSPLLCCAKFS